MRQTKTKRQALVNLILSSYILWVFGLLAVRASMGYCQMISHLSQLQEDGNLILGDLYYNMLIAISFIASALVLLVFEVNRRMEQVKLIVYFNLHYVEVVAGMILMSLLIFLYFGFMYHYALIDDSIFNTLMCFQPVNALFILFLLIRKMRVNQLQEEEHGTD